MSGMKGSSGPVRDPIRKFNPGTLQSDRELIDQFAVRERELGIVLDVLRGNIDAPSCQHVLIVAPRGRGKTMLLARAMAELRTNEAISRFLLPVRFMEESHEIFGIADFWLEALFHLARELAAGRPEISRELGKTHADLAGRWGERALGDLARTAVLDAADRLDRKLVLAVENLQSLSGNVDDDFGWQLRQSLQSEPRIVLLASATGRFEGLDDPEQPFFDLFRTVDLRPLDTESCRMLWQSVTGNRAGARDIRPLQILTGGNPRLLVIVAGFARHRSLRRLMEELVGLVDEHTEYFRGHLEVLPKGERRVYVAVLDLWRPSTAGEIAARARMDIRPVSTMLGRLVHRGALLPDPAGGPNKRLYSAAEPLYSIYYKLRRERDEAAVVESLIRFMVAFYDPSEMVGICTQFHGDAIESEYLTAGIVRAFAGRPPGSDPSTETNWAYVGIVAEQLEQYRAITANSRLMDDIEAAIRDKAWEKVIALADRHADLEGITDASGLTRQYLFPAAIKSSAFFELGELEQVIAIGDEVTERFRGNRDNYVLRMAADILLRRAHAQFIMENFEAAIEACEDVLLWFKEFDDPPFNQFAVAAWVLQAQSYAGLDDRETATLLLDRVLQRFGTDESPEMQWWTTKALVGKANNLCFDKLDYPGAIGIFDQVIERFHESDTPGIEFFTMDALLNKAIAQRQLDEFDSEIMSYQEAIDVAGNSGEHGLRWRAALALGLKAVRLAEMGRVQDSLDASAELERRLGTLEEDERPWFAWLAASARAIAMLAGEDFPAAITGFRLAYRNFSTRHKAATMEMVGLVRNFIARGAPEDDILKVLSSDRDKKLALAPLIVALRQRAGETVREPAEVMEVAADIRKRIEEQSAKGILTAF